MSVAVFSIAAASGALLWTWNVYKNSLDVEVPTSKKKKKNNIRRNVADYKPLFGKDDDESVLVDCGTMEELSASECDTRDPKACSHCKGSMTCSRKPINVSTKGRIVVIPPPSDVDKGRCIPLERDDFSCNAYTGNSILASREGEIFWYCDPKFPALVTKKGYFDDVEDDSPACSGVGVLVHPETGRPWRDTMDFVPTAGVCRCPHGYASAGTECANDSCYPGHKNGRGCVCPSGHVECGVGCAAFDDWELKYHCPGNTPKCVPDPCRKGSFDEITKECRPANDFYVTVFDEEYYPRRGHVVDKKWLDVHKWWCDHW